jgi:hypothetical protein
MIELMYLIHIDDRTKDKAIDTYGKPTIWHDNGQNYVLGVVYTFNESSH